jgi:hypothetical protein
MISWPPVRLDGANGLNVNISLEVPGVSVGMRIARVRRGIGNMIMIDLEAEREEVMPMIWIDTCDWDLWRGEELLIDTRESYDEAFERCLPELAGKKIAAVRETSDHAHVVFDLSSGYRLEIDEASDRYRMGQSLFSVFLGEKYAISYKYPGGLTYAPGFD